MHFNVCLLLITAQQLIRLSPLVTEEQISQIFNSIRQDEQDFVRFFTLDSLIAITQLKSQVSPIRSH